MLLTRIRQRLGGGTDEVAQIVRAVSDGDLNVRIANGVSEGCVLDSIGTMVQGLSGHMRSIDLESKQVAQSAYQISQISERIVEAASQEQARSSEVPQLCCEYNLQPPNPGSAAFHARHGFVEVGQQQLSSSKRVSMQRLLLADA